MRRALLTALTFAMLLGCESDTRPAREQQRVVAARMLNDAYAQSRLANWKFHARAAGSDCSVLFIETPMLLEDALTEALHYGRGAYGVLDGGVERFCREKTFRAAAYRDSSGRIWAYGVRETEARALPRCE